jgi:hypothetical protein
MHSLNLKDAPRTLYKRRMPPKKQTISVQRRLLPKKNPVPPEDSPEHESPLVPPPKPPTPPPRSVMIVERPREAMIGNSFPVQLPQKDFPVELVRIGVDRVGGSIFHCILRSIYVPYLEWNRERCIRKVKEFRQDLASNFEGYYLRLDQRTGKWPQIHVCKRELEFTDGLIKFEYLDYIGKIINKSIVLLNIDQDGILRPLPGTRVYAKQSPPPAQSNTKTNSPITYMRSEATYIFILHLGGPAYEVLGMKKDGRVFTLFPESHPVTRTLLEGI